MPGVTSSSSESHDASNKPASLANRNKLSSAGDADFPHPGLRTELIQALSTVPDFGQPLSLQSEFASTFLLDPVNQSEPYFYARNASPSVHTLERAITSLEKGAESVVSASGMAAVTSIFRALLRTDDVLVIPADGYYWTRNYANQYLAAWGVKVIELPSASFMEELSQLSIHPTVVLLESPSNPMLDIINIVQVSQWCQAHGSLLAVDNTTASPLGQCPLELGADLVVASGTKFLSGHSDLLYGYVCSHDPTLMEKVRYERTASGGIISQYNSWLAARSLITFPSRFHQACHNAHIIAEYLAQHPAVEFVRYPGLPTDPQHSLAMEQMKLAGGMVSIELKNSDTCRRLLTEGTLIHCATSFGGYHTTVDPRARWGDKVGQNFVRIAVGLEDAKDLIAEFESLLS